MTALTESLEDYLEAIWVLGMNQPVVRVKDIAGFLKVSTPSVAGAVRSLTDRDLVNHEKYGYIQLTDTGAQHARDIYERHVIIRHFFHDILNVDQGTAEQDACHVEHYISQQTFTQLTRLIELMDRHLDELPWLSNLKSGQDMPDSSMLQEHFPGILDSREAQNTVHRLTGDELTRARLLRLGLRPGSSVELIDSDNSAELIELQVDGQIVQLTRSDAENILVNSNKEIQ